MHSLRVVLILIMVRMVYIQVMYRTAVNDQFTGYNKESVIGSSLRMLKVNTAPCMGAVKRETLSNTIITCVNIRHNRRTVPMNVNPVPILNIL